VIAVSDIGFGYPRPRPIRRGGLLRELIGEELRRIRLEQHRTLADVAATANLSLAYLSEIERGLKEASSEVLAALCEALGIALGDLLDGVQTRLERRLADHSVIELASRSRISGRTESGPTACAA
jgi:transcriptional regulator with XRE-family HTH domain